MEVKCEYCGSMIPEKAEKCPNCGATNENMKRAADSTPKTIEELKNWYAAHNLPPYETTRFFIGINYKGPKAFGIYEENGNFVVYKNKDTGERAVRYEGKDEAYAVNEIYLKLKSEILNQKAHQISSQNVRSSKGKSSEKKDWIWMIIAFFGFDVFVFSGLGSIIGSAVFAMLAAGGVFLLVALLKDKVTFIKDLLEKLKAKFKKTGLLFLTIWLVLSAVFFVPINKFNTVHYYSYDDTIYCSYHNSWYAYDSFYDDYYSVNEDYLPVQMYNSPADYEYDYKGYDWDDSEEFTRFESSDYYADNIAGSSDSDYDWDSSDSWDSGSTDWGSDW